MKVIVMGGTPTPLLCLDLDDTVRKGKNSMGRFVNGPEDVYVFPEVIEMMRRWKEGGGRIIGVSNQGGVSLGHLSAAAVSAAMAETQRQCLDMFDDIAWCTHHPNSPSPLWSSCWCRKPFPGMVITAAYVLSERFGESYPPSMGLFVGDREEDEGCAKACGLDFQWAPDWRAKALVEVPPRE